MSLLMSYLGRQPASLSLAGDDRYYETVPTRTAAGVRVDENTAFNYSVCWAATRLLGGTAGWLPLNLHKKLSGGGAEIAKKHRVHRLIHDQPNSEMGSMMFRARGVNHQVNWGNSFSEIVFTSGGIPNSLEPIHPRRIPKENIRREDGKIVYYVNPPNGVGKPQRIPQEKMLHVPSIISDDGIIGKGVITAARESIGKAIGTQKRGASAINHGGAPPLALKGAKFKDDAAREEYRRQINDVHGGPENAGKWLILPKDSEVQMLGFSLQDSQYIESEQFDIEEMARWYGVPPHLIGHLLRATFNNIEELGISFVKYSLIMWLRLWEQEIWRKLLTKDEQENYYARFNVDALERGNLQSRTEAGVKNFFNGHWTLNEWADKDDMNPVTETVMIDGKETNLGDVRFVQQAMIPLAQAAKGPPEVSPPTPPAKEEETPPEDNQLKADISAVAAGTAALAMSVEKIAASLATIQQESAAGQREISVKVQEIAAAQAEFATSQEGLSLSIQTASDGVAQLTARYERTSAESSAMHKQLSAAMLRDVVARLLSVELHNIKNIAQSASRFDQRLSAFYDKHRKTMETALLSPVSVALLASGRQDEPAEFVRGHIEGHVTASIQQLLGVCDCTEDQLAGKVEECVSKWHEERATVSI